jgi:hypothetical protein
VGPTRASDPYRQRSGVLEFAIGAAGEAHRAFGTTGPGGETYRFSELHHRLVEIARMVRREDREERRLEASADAPVAHVALLPGPASGDPQTVRLERDLGPVEGDRRDGPGGVRADPGKSLELSDGGREPSPVLPYDSTGCLEEVVGPGVVAGALPDFEDATEGSTREVVHRRKGVHESLEVGSGLRDARLLKENLGHPDPVRVAVRPPRERTTLQAIPTEQGGGEFRRKRLPDRR